MGPHLLQYVSSLPLSFVILEFFILFISRSCSCLFQPRRHLHAQPRAPETRSAGRALFVVRVPLAAPYAEPRAEQAQSELVVAIEVVEQVALSSWSGAGNLSGRQTAPKAVVAQAAKEVLVEASSRSGSTVVGPTEQTVPLPPPARGHEIEASMAAETLVPAATQAGGDVAEVSTTDAMSTSILEIIDLDTPDLPSNDRDMLVDSVESGVEASGSATPVVAASTKAVEPTNEEPMSGATALGQLTLGQARGVGGPEPSIVSEPAEGVLGDLAAGMELTLVVPYPRPWGWTRPQMRLWSHRLSGSPPYRRDSTRGKPIPLGSARP
jgi:hypothetical protein